MAGKAAPKSAMDAKNSATLTSYKKWSTNFKASCSFNQNSEQQIPVKSNPAYPTINYINDRINRWVNEHRKNK